MKTFVLLSTAAALVVAAPAAQAVGVFSANGFQCTSSPSKDRSLVECTGVFPGVAGIFGGIGADFVHVEYSPDNKVRYVFMSDTGCLIMTAADGNTGAVNASGAKNKFGNFNDAMGWCYGGLRREAGPAQPAKPAAPTGPTQPMQPAPTTPVPMR